MISRLGSLKRCCSDLEVFYLIRLQVVQSKLHNRLCHLVKIVTDLWSKTAKFPQFVYLWYFSLEEMLSKQKTEVVSLPLPRMM